MVNLITAGIRTVYLFFNCYSRKLFLNLTKKLWKYIFLIHVSIMIDLENSWSSVSRESYYMFTYHIPNNFISFEISVRVGWENRKGGDNRACWQWISFIGWFILLSCYWINMFIYRIHAYFFLPRTTFMFTLCKKSFLKQENRHWNLSPDNVKNCWRRHSWPLPPLKVR